MTTARPCWYRTTLSGDRRASANADRGVIVAVLARKIIVHANADRGVIVAVLARKIIVGGAGNWAAVPMVPSEHVTPEEARVIAAWILDLQEP